MAEDYESDFLTIEQIAGTLSHSYPNRFAVSIGEEADIVVRLLDTEGNPMANATVSVEKYTDTLTLPMAVITDKDGRAVFHTTRSPLPAEMRPSIWKPTSIPSVPQSPQSPPPTSRTSLSWQAALS